MKMLRGLIALLSVLSLPKLCKLQLLPLQNMFIDVVLFYTVYVHRAFSLCVVAGLLFGFQFLPIQYLKNCDDGAHSCDGTVAVSVVDLPSL